MLQHIYLLTYLLTSYLLTYLLTYWFGHCVSDCIVGRRDGKVNTSVLLLRDLCVFECDPADHHLPTTIRSLPVTSD